MKKNSFVNFTMLFIFNSVVIYGLLGCTKETDEPSPPTPDIQAEVFNYKSSEIYEIKKITTDKVQNVAFSDINSYLKEFIELNKPQKLSFKEENKVSILKANDFTESYSIQWENNAFFIQDEGSLVNYCGEKKENELFFDITYYYMINKTDQRTLQVVSKSYTINSYTDILPDSSSTSFTIFWIKVKYVLEAPEIKI